ncbi:MAG: DegV family protein [Lachnospiraceae bacterium]|nr:DegV family protein [Lachnospiraceae bacterium]
MSKIAVVTDSNSGITQAEGKKLGINVIPMPFMIGENEFFEDINLSQDEFYEKLKGGENISTSQPNLTVVADFWRNLLKDYDEIIHIPMSSGLSGSCQSAYMLSQEDEFDGKVFVIDNQRISVTQRQSAIDARDLAAKGFSGQEIADILMRDKFKSSIYIMLDTLFYLKKGGRITPAAAAIGTLLKLKPVLQIQGEKLDAFSKARTSSIGREQMINAIKNDIETRFGGLENAKENVYLEIAYTYDEAVALDFKEQVLTHFPGFDIVVNPLSLSVACHIGPGAIALATCMITPELK